MNMTITESSGDIFKDLGFSAADSEVLHIKAGLMMEIEKYIKENKLTQEKAAQIMGVSRPRVSDAIRGKIDKFTIDSLVDMLTKAGRHVKVTVHN